MDVCLCDTIPVAIQGIPLKRVCRCRCLQFLRLSHLAIQVFSLEKVCRCTNVCLYDVISAAIQGISLKRVCR